MSQPETLLGKKIGNYVVVRLLGAGGMGEVYLAEHPQIGRKVAIKVLAAHLLTTAQLATRFLDEARAVARIDHPNVIDLYDFGTLEDGRPYYMMEVLKGQELRAVIETRRKLTAQELWPYLEQICAGLQAAHDSGVVHRDLKPENVFILDRQPLTLKLLDFGIAKLLEVEQGSGLTSSGMVMGTPLFIAPEQALGQPERISPRTDLYSLGVILYWMLAGQPPFSHDANAILLAMHIRDAPPPLRELEPSIPPPIAALVEHCLAKEPEGRPASAAELARTFAAALAAEGSVPAPRATSVTPAPSTAAVDLLTGGAAPLPPTLSAESVARPTTFSASVGEVAAPDGHDVLPRRPTLKWVALGLGALVVVGSVVFTLAREDGPQAPSSAPGAAPPGEAVTAVPPPGERVRPAGPPPATPTPDATRAPAPPRHQIMLRAGDPRVRCRVRVGERELPSLADPCRFQAAPGQRVRLEVTRPGYKLLLVEWTAAADRTIAVEVRKSERRLAIAGSAAPRGAARVAGKPAARPAAKPAARPVAVKPVAAPVTTPLAKPVAKPTPPPQPEPPPKPKPRKIGEGTMELPD